MMTPQESQALQEFLAQLTQVQGITKDAQASSMIATAFARQPDAGYLLVQRAMLQDQALNAARAQINQLQAQLQAEREARMSAGSGGSGGSFLDPATAWGNSATDIGRSSPGGLGGPGGPGGRMAPPPAATRYQPQASAPMQPQYADPQAGQYAPPPRPGLFGGGGGSSFLGSMAATAAGVAGGAFLFQGIESLMGHHGGGASGLMGQNGQAPIENTTVNNYYGSDNDTGANNDVAQDGGQQRLLGDASDTGGNDLFGNNDFAGNDDLGSADDISSI
jgi:hypothetical protein